MICMLGSFVPVLFQNVFTIETLFLTFGLDVFSITLLSGSSGILVCIFVFGPRVV